MQAGGRSRAGGIAELEELSARVKSILSAYGYQVEELSYPENHLRRSIDVLAWNERGLTLFLKITLDTADLPAAEVRELRRTSRVLRANPLIVAEREKGAEIEEIVAFERAGVYVVGREGLEAALRNEIYVVGKQRGLYMRLRGPKLRETREEKGMSLGDLAALIGVSRRSVYLYEREEIDISLDRALRLLEALGEEVFAPIPVIRESPCGLGAEKSDTRADTRDERVILERLGGNRGVVVHVKHAALDIAASIENQRMVFIVEHGRRNSIVERGEDAAKIGAATGSQLYAIVRTDTLRRDLEFLGFETYKRPEELVEELMKELSSQS